MTPRNATRVLAVSSAHTQPLFPTLTQHAVIPEPVRPPHPSGYLPSSPLHPNWRPPCSLCSEPLKPNDAYLKGALTRPEGMLIPFETLRIVPYVTHYDRHTLRQGYGPSRRSEVVCVKESQSRRSTDNFDSDWSGQETQALCIFMHEWVCALCAVLR